MGLIDKLKNGLKIVTVSSLGLLALNCSDEESKVEAIETIIPDIFYKPPVIKTIEEYGRASFNLYWSDVDTFKYFFEGNRIGEGGIVYNRLTLREDEGPSSSRYLITLWEKGPDGVVDKIVAHKIDFNIKDTLDILSWNFENPKESLPKSYPMPLLPNKKLIYKQSLATKDYARAIEVIF